MTWAAIALVDRLLTLVSGPTVWTETLVPPYVALAQSSIQAWNCSTQVDESITIIPRPSNGAGAAVVSTVPYCTRGTILTGAGVTLACAVSDEARLAFQAYQTRSALADVTIVFLEARSSIKAGGGAARSHCLAILSLELPVALTSVVVQQGDASPSIQTRVR